MSLSTLIPPKQAATTFPQVANPTLWQRYAYFRPWFSQATPVDAAPEPAIARHFVDILSAELGEDAPRVHLCLSQPVESIEAHLQRLSSVWNEGDSATFYVGRLDGTSPKSLIETVESHLPGLGASVSVLHQEIEFPHRLVPGADPGAACYVITLGALALPHWPAIGLAIPTCGGSDDVRSAIESIAAGYPGEATFIVIANGCENGSLDELCALAADWQHFVRLSEQDRNLGFGVGCNIGLSQLMSGRRCQLVGVCNDDVLAAPDCIAEMVCAMAELQRQGYTPGVIGPVSNEIHGAQRVEIGITWQSDNASELIRDYRTEHHDEATQVEQLRGLMMLCQPELIERIGGFDPIFGLGNCEDDDFNIRTSLAGFSTWIANGAFLLHRGSSTFQRLGMNYETSIQRNVRRFLDKWGVDSYEAAFMLQRESPRVDLRVPIGNPGDELATVCNMNGKQLDLVLEATRVEFAAWLAYALVGRSPHVRRQIIRAVFASDPELAA